MFIRRAGTHSTSERPRTYRPPFPISIRPLRKIPDTHWLIPDWRIPIRFYLADAICECIGGGFSGGRLGICDAESVGHAQFLAGFPEDAITTCGKIV
jgi:hypothetical protein